MIHYQCEKCLIRFRHKNYLVMVKRSTWLKVKEEWPSWSTDVNDETMVKSHGLLPNPYDPLRHYGGAKKDVTLLSQVIIHTTVRVPCEVNVNIYRLY